MVLEIQLQSIKCMAVTRIHRNTEQIFIPIKVLQAITVFRRKQTTSIFFTCLALPLFCRLYNILIFLLLTNNFTNSCSKSVKFKWVYEWLIMIMVCKRAPGGWKGWQKVKTYIVDQDHQRCAIVVDHSSKSKCL